jgi:predicted transcriptional regulator
MDSILPRDGNGDKQKMRISFTECIAENCDMHTQDYRRRNLARALDELGIKQAEFARMVNRPAPNISQLIRKDRPFGHELAREFETTLGLRYGWLDEEIPLTDKAIGIARAFQVLNDDHQREVGELVLAFKAIEEHQEEVRRLKPNSASSAG